ncbi:Peptidyl-prolyl cis-trans isomerase [Granulibacter bethesdensis]|uniref:Parvulin-like PPIase n=2 Tax=Granulibacter bethesdensis TaxID=364410 RepID=A0AAN0RD30_9PROT|nr:Peptidyl-prolyl cis-trans isomerase [Granulibacter bethesdensis]
MVPALIRSMDTCPMLATFRNSLNAWPVRLLFGLLVLAFVGWGFSDVWTQATGGGALATVNGARIEPQAFQATYQRELNRVRQQMGGGRQDVPPDIRKMVAQQALQQMVTETVLDDLTGKMGLTTPDADIRQATYAMPAFKNDQGQFDQARFQAVLNSVGLTEDSYVAYLRRTITERQLLDAIRAGASAPEILVAPLFAWQKEQRSGDMIDVPVSAAPAPPQPTDKQLERYWANHPARYTAPEYRRIKAIVLTPETVAKAIEVPEKDLRAWYEANGSHFDTPEKRDVSIVLVPDEAKAKALAEQWKNGADWKKISALANADDGSAVELTDITRQQLPLPDLMPLAFETTKTDQIAGPVHDSLGWHIVRVGKIQPATHRSFEEMKEDIKQILSTQRAMEQIYDRSSHLDEAFAQGSTLDDKLPDADAVAAISGQLDMQGNTREGTPAPIPGSDQLKQALITAAFSMKKGDAPHLVPVTPQSQPGTPAGPTTYFAVQVEDIIPGALRPFPEVKAEVTADWIQDKRHHSQEEAATRAMLALQEGKSVADAVTLSGGTLKQIPLLTRKGETGDVSADTRRALFALKLNDSTMVNTPDGFAVIRLTRILSPTEKDDPAAFSQAREQITQGLAEDLENTFLASLRSKADARVNNALLQRIMQQ